MITKIDNDGQIIVIDNEHLESYDHINIAIKEDEKITLVEAVSLDELIAVLESFKKLRDLSRERERTFCDSSCPKIQDN